jgi:hypothetical protein
LCCLSFLFWPLCCLSFLLWSLCCLSFFILRFLITALVSLSFSWPCKYSELSFWFT